MRHACPRKGCVNREIDNRLFCCHGCWFDLSLPARNRIYATAALPVLAGPRRRAIEAAMAEWRALDGGTDKEV